MLISKGCTFICLDGFLVKVLHNLFYFPIRKQNALKIIHTLASVHRKDVQNWKNEEGVFIPGI